MEGNEREKIYEFESGTLIRAEQINDYWLRGPYEIRSNDGREWERDNHTSARALAAIVDWYEEPETDVEEGFVTVEVALDGKPAIATFLCGVHAYSKEEAAEIMDVTEDTITKYLSRFRPPFELL